MLVARGPDRCIFFTPPRLSGCFNNGLGTFTLLSCVLASGPSTACACSQNCCCDRCSTYKAEAIVTPTQCAWNRVHKPFHTGHPAWALRHRLRQAQLCADSTSHTSNVSPKVSNTTGSPSPTSTSCSPVTLLWTSMSAIARSRGALSSRFRFSRGRVSCCDSARVPNPPYLAASAI